jgi:hypothetical protein
MPNPRNKAKATGDTHLPEVEADEFAEQEAHPEGTGTEAGGDGRKSGPLKDREVPTGDSGNTPESGET